MGYRNWKRHLLALTMASSMILSTGSIGAEEPLIEDIGVEISQNMEEEQSVDIMEDSSAVAETQEVEDGSDILNVDTTDDIWEILEDSENISTVEDDVLNTETEEIQKPMKTRKLQKRRLPRKFWIFWPMKPGMGLLRRKNSSRRRMNLRRNFGSILRRRAAEMLLILLIRKLPF